MSDKIKMWLGILFFIAMCGLSIYGSFKYPHLYLIPGDYSGFVPNSIAMDRKTYQNIALVKHRFFMCFSTNTGV